MDALLELEYAADPRNKARAGVLTTPPGAKPRFNGTMHAEAILALLANTGLSATGGSAKSPENPIVPATPLPPEFNLLPLPPLDPHTR